MSQNESATEDVEMKSTDNPSQNSTRKTQAMVNQKRREEESRLHEILRVVNCAESLCNFSSFFVIPIFLSIRTSGRDRHKHSILQISYMMASPLEKLEEQPARTINVEFDPSTQIADPKHLERFGLNIDDFVRAKNPGKDLSTIKEAITELFDVLIVLGQEQCDKAKRLMRAIEVKPRVMFFIYNDSDAVQFFYHWFLPHYKFSTVNMPHGDSLYNICEDGLLDMENNLYPLKLESKYDVNILKKGDKIKKYYNMLTDLPFPEPLGELVNHDPLYSVADEFHILLIVYCTIRIPDFQIAHYFCTPRMASMNRIQDIMLEAQPKMPKVEYDVWPTTTNEWFIPDRLMKEARERIMNKMKLIKPQSANAAE